MAKKINGYAILVGTLVILALIVYVILPGNPMGNAICPGSQYYCPGVGCVSGKDKCFTGSMGGPSKVFSKETFFGGWPGIGTGSTPPLYGTKEAFVSKKCPDNTRSDGPCLMEF